ncbi:MAG: agmatinase [Rhodospirillales bacterium]
MSSTEDRNAIPIPTFATRETFMGTEHTGPGHAISVAGIPFDIATTNRSGARDGPAALRRASRMIGGTYPDTPGNAWELDIADVGNMPILMGNIDESLRLIEEFAGGHEHLISLGGDHLVTLPLLRALAKKHGPLGLVHFDAHVDTWADNFGAPVTHGTNFYIAINEGIIDPKRYVQIGIRCDVEPEVWQWTLDQGVTIITAEDVHNSSPEAIASKIKDVVGDGRTYLTFDIDGLDPSFAPGTGTPVVGGLQTWQARGIITRLQGVDFRGMDLVEVAPMYDGSSELTALAGASMIAFYLGLLAANKNGG